MNRTNQYAGFAEHQGRALDQAGLFTRRQREPWGQGLRATNPAEAGAGLEDRARSYLAVNCAPCHVEAGGGNSRMDLDLPTRRDRMQLIGARPQHETFGLRDAMLVAPGEPGRSVLLERLSRRGRGQMPPLGSTRVDAAAVELFRQWIASLPPDPTPSRAWQISDFTAALASSLHERPLPAGAALFRSAGCADCHRVAGQGGAVGPDLTGLGRRQTPAMILESILDPSKVIPEEFALHEVETADGEIHSGRLERETPAALVLRPLAFGERAQAIDPRTIRRRHRSNVSPMPAGMADRLSLEQILDLLAYLLADEAAQLNARP